VGLVAPGAKSLFEAGFGSRGKLRVVLGMGLRFRTPRDLPQDQQLLPVLRAGLADPIMEL